MLVNYFLLFLSVAIGTVRAILFKKTGNNNDMSKVAKSNLILFVFALVFIIPFAVVSFIQEGGIKVPILLAVFYGFFTITSQIFLKLAMGAGPLAISTLLYYCGFIIPTVFGSIRYDESVHFLQWIGIALIIVAFILNVSGKSDKKGSFKWFIFVLLGSISSGAVGVLQKVFSKDFGEYSLNPFLCVSFVFIIFFALIVVLIFRKDKNKEMIESDAKKEKMPVSLLIIMAILGLTLGALNILNTYLSGALSSVLFFPIVNGGPILLTTLFSMLLLKEKLSKKQVVGLIVGFIAIALIAVGKALIQ